MFDAFAQPAAATEQPQAASNFQQQHVTIGNADKGRKTLKPVRQRLEHLLLNARTPEPEPLPCVCLMLERSSLRQFMPDEREVLLEGDRLLFAGRGGARREMVFSLTEPTTLVSLATGRHQPRGAIMRRLARKRAG